MVGDPHSDFWRHRKVLVTGGNGFLGSAVLRELHDVGAAEVVAPSAAEYDLRRREDAEAMIASTPPTWSSTWPPRSAGSAPTWNGRRTCTSTTS